MEETHLRIKTHPFRRGDTVEITVDDAPIRAGRRTVGTAKKGDTFKVLAVFPQNVRVESASAANPSVPPGWLALEHVKLADGAPRGDGRPLLRQLGESVSEAELEVITASERGQ